MHGHPIAKKLEKWWTEHGLKAEDDEWIAWLNTYDKLLRIKYEELRTEHVNEIKGKRVFGLSKAAGCSRAAELSLLDAPHEPRTGSTNFTFFLGHSVEIAALASLVHCGYDLKDTQTVVRIGDSMQSTTDGVISLLGSDVPISVKSSAYKMSGGKRQPNGSYKFVRRGFPELPFEGVKQSEPAYWAQLQMEMYANNWKRGLILFVAKDIVKAFENDEYLGKQNGSLTFYAELVPADIKFAERLEKFWSKRYNDTVRSKTPGNPLYMKRDLTGHIELVAADYNPDNIWGGENQVRTGAFNPCGGCDVREACRTWDIRGTE